MERHLAVHRVLVIGVVLVVGGLSSGVASGSAPTVTVNAYSGRGGEKGTARVVFTFRGSSSACAESSPDLELRLLRAGAVVWRATCFGSGGIAGRVGLFDNQGGGGHETLWPRLQHPGRHGFTWTLFWHGQPIETGRFTVTAKILPPYRIYQGRDAFQNYCKNKHRAIWSAHGRLYCNFPRRVWYSFALAGG